MKWDEAEIEILSPILARMEADLGLTPSGGGQPGQVPRPESAPAARKSIFVLCSAGGDVALRLARYPQVDRVVGVELDDGLLAESRRRVAAAGLAGKVEFEPAEKTRIPAASGTFDGVISEFIIYPTCAPTEIGQPEMARVLKPGGTVLLTDVIVTKPLPADARAELLAIGLDYLCEATPDDFRQWMEQAGLTSVEVVDMTPVVRGAWEHRRKAGAAARRGAGNRGFGLLLEDPNIGLGHAIHYVYVRGQKPR